MKSHASLSLREIAALTGALEAARAGADRRIRHVRAIGRADAESLVFAEDAASLASALASKAGAILCRQDTEAAEEDRLLRVRDPRYAFALCARALERQTGGETVIHPGAVVDASAQLGARIRVGAGAVIEARAVVGDDVVIGSNAVIGEGVILGARVVVQAGAVLGSKGFGYVRNHESGEYLLFPQNGDLIIEDDVEIGANTTIDRGALQETRIGAGTKIDNLVHIGHNCRIGRNVVIAAQVGISGSCTIGDGVILAGQVGISDHCEIGPGVILGGQAGVYRGKSVVGPGEIFSGTPAEPLRDQMRSLAQVRALARKRRKQD